MYTVQQLKIVQEKILGTGLKRQCEETEAMVATCTIIEVFKLIRSLKAEFKPVTRAIRDKSGKMLTDENQISLR